MTRNIPHELKTHKEEFDFLHKKIGELEWDIATMYFGKRAIIGSERETMVCQLETYREHMCLFIEKLHQDISNHNKKTLPPIGRKRTD